MNSIADFEFDRFPLSEGVILISQTIRHDFASERVRQMLQQLVTQARENIDTSLDHDQQLEQLLTLFFTCWGFGSASGVYRFSDTLWLDTVLSTRKGTPVSLGIIFLHIAQALDIPICPVIFPTQLIMRADWLDDDVWLINPINGETLDEHVLEVWLKGNLGSMMTLEADDFDEAENVSVVRKMLTTLKAALMEEKQMELALRASEVLLAFDPRDPYEIRDRGLIYACLECNHVALIDLNYFVKQCPEDPVAEMIKEQIHTIEQTQVVLH